MKKIFILSMLAILLFTNVAAQDVYNEIREKATEHVSNPLTNDLVKQINRFKVDALDYMLIKMREQMPDSTATFLDKQAFAMNNFVNLYLKKVLEYRTMPQAQQVKVLKAFMDASYSNPLFNDTDTELTLGYYANGDCLTRFSLDTDWRRAILAASAIMKEMEGK